MNRFKCLWVFLILSTQAFSQESSLTKPRNGSVDALHLFSDPKEMDDYIYREPLLAYQQILNSLADFETMSPLNKRQWLLRKALAEHTLYLYEPFEETIAQAKPLMKGVTEPTILSQYYLYLGAIHERKGQYEKAQGYFEQVTSIAKVNKLAQFYILAKQALAYNYSMSELVEMSITDLQEAYIEANRLDDVYLMGSINETYGAIYANLGEYEKSLEYYQKSLEAYLIKGYESKAADVIYGVASTYRSAKNHDKAITYFIKYQKAIEPYASRHLKFFAAYGMGMTLAEKGECEQALTVIEQALSYQSLEDFDAELYKRQSSCYITLKQLTKARVAFNNAQNIYQKYPELTDTRWQLEMLKVESLLNYAEGHYQQSFDLLSRYYQKYLTLIDSHSNVRILKLRANLEIERKGMASAINKQRSKIHLLQQEKIEQQTTEKHYLLFFILVFVILMCGVLMAQYRNHQKVLSLSNRDPLSNLYNRRYIFDYLERVFITSKSRKSALSIISIDIDNFKQINDKYGHPFGDEVIRSIAKIGQEVLRTNDVMARVGGEEFLCVLPRTEHSQSVLVAQRLLKSIANFEFFTPKGDPFSTTVSIGIARMNEHVVDSDMLYVQADQALYQSKRAGKNRVTVFKYKARD